MSFLSNVVALLEGELEVNAIPVVVNALTIYQKNPNALGLIAAEQSILANGPAALLTAESAAVAALNSAIQAKLQAQLTSAQAGLATATAAL